MENYDASVMSENLRALTEMFHNDDRFFPDAYAAAVANYEAAHHHRNGKGYGRGGNISYPPRRTTYYYEISGSGLGFYYEGTLAPYGGSIIKNLFNKAKNIVGRVYNKAKKFFS